MQNKKLESDWKKLVSQFEPYKGYEPEDYYGVSIIKTKSDNKYRIKLMYDYLSNSMLSKNSIDVSSLETALKYYTILDTMSKNKGVVHNADNLLGDDSEDSTPW